MRTLRTILLLLVGLSCPLSLHPQTCGGTERWQVKVGTDSASGSVQLDTIVQTTVQDAIQLSEPLLPPQNDNNTRLPEEVHVYQLRGHLAQFKQETNDNDYHLVITDDTLQFTNDGSHHGTGHSLIAEIPDPNCIPGQHGDPNVPSRFISQINCTRGRMDAKFPNADKTGNFNDTGGIPVTLTGIGFFDRPHGQTGRASNNLEIHPILDIDFGDGQPSCFQGSVPAADFSVAATPAALTIALGGSDSTSLLVTPLGGFSGAVSFSVSGLPDGVSAITSPASNGSPKLTLTVSPTASAATSSLTVTGTSGAISHTAPLALTVSASAPNAGKWEYKLVTATTAEALASQANTLGAQGWELAGVAFDSTRSDSYVGFMKRAVVR